MGKQPGEHLRQLAVVSTLINLLSGEVLDSMSVLRLAAFVGDAFAIDVQPADFVVDNFRNVEAIALYVHRATTARAAERR